MTASEGTSAVAPQVIPFKPTTQTDAIYVRDYVRRILNNDPPGAPDKGRANGTYEVLLSLHNSAVMGGNVRETWERCVFNRPELAEYTPQKPRWNIYHASELSKLPPLEFLIPGFLVARALNVMYGQPGIGKSFISLRMAEGLSQTVPVVYIAGEGASGYARRMEALELRNNRKAGKLYFVSSAVNLLSLGEVMEFIEAVRSIKPQLIVFDTLARCTPGADENSGRDYSTAVDNLTRIQNELETATLVVHHTGVEGSRERGHSSLRGAADSMIKVSNSDGLIKVENDKMKDDLIEGIWYMRLEPYGNSVAAVKSENEPSNPDIRLTKNQFVILNALNLETFVDSGCRVADLISIVQVTKSTVYEVVSVLLKSGMLSKEGRFDPYKITFKGREALRKHRHSPEIRPEYQKKSTSDNVRT